MVSFVRFLRWDQIELMVCGDPKVDLALLRKVCKYEGFSEADDTIRMFWEVMEEISEKDRVQASVNNRRQNRHPA